MIADIIIAALGIFLVAFMIYRFIKPPKNGCCSKCSGNCEQCHSCKESENKSYSCKNDVHN